MESFEVFCWGCKFSIISKVLCRISTVNFQSHSLQAWKNPPFWKKKLKQQKQNFKMVEGHFSFFLESSSVRNVSLVFCSISIIVVPILFYSFIWFDKYSSDNRDQCYKTFLIHVAGLSYGILNLTNILNKTISVWVWTRAWGFFFCRFTLSRLLHNFQR